MTESEEKILDALHIKIGDIIVYDTPEGAHVGLIEKIRITDEPDDPERTKVKTFRTYKEEVKCN